MILKSVLGHTIGWVALLKTENSKSKTRLARSGETVREFPRSSRVTTRHTREFILKGSKAHAECVGGVSFNPDSICWTSVTDSLASANGTLLWLRLLLSTCSVLVQSFLRVVLEEALPCVLRRWEWSML